MFGKKQQAQPKEAYEQPEVVVEDVSEEQLSYTEKLLHRHLNESLNVIIRPKANPSIISKVYK